MSEQDPAELGLPLGFGLSGNPIALIEALLTQGTSDLSVVSNNCGVDEWGLGVLLAARRIRKRRSRPCRACLSSTR